MIESKIITATSNWPELFDSIGYSELVVLVDENTKEMCLPYVVEHLIQERKFTLIETKSGESSKEISNAERLWRELMDANIDRNAMLICLGGGVVCDLGGYVASTYKRGIRTMYIPTTNLAMCDASIGGKTGVNFNGIKNQIGTFHPPTHILVEVELLKTLDPRHVISGYAETIKHALISDPSFWATLIEKNDHSMSSNGILRSMQIKRDIIKEDYLDTGSRQALNFGHTVGHAIESASQEGTNSLLHGEAIAIGMVAESYLATKLAGLEMDSFEAIQAHIMDTYKGVQFPVIDTETYLSHMRQDKKNTRSGIICSLISSIGTPALSVVAMESELIDALEFTKKAWSR
ncbi:MAG TPA: 3-dehydroquinate synthase [Flavobacteriales bacterium]|jgi:3-dehydroquinate synthase|nr:3-dehydroquinate synthase [Flavobacteriales bacterium]HAW18719.1 3-dehydroquinate synthase [Flavobacteriales bacterium]